MNLEEPREQRPEFLNPGLGNIQKTLNLEASGARSMVNKGLLSQRRNNQGTRRPLRDKAADLNRTQPGYRWGVPYVMPVRPAPSLPLPKV